MVRQQFAKLRPFKKRSMGSIPLPSANMVLSFLCLRTGKDILLSQANGKELRIF